MNTSTPRILVTGHMGFIGAWTAFLFKREGWSVYGLDDRSSYGERLYDVAGLNVLMDGERECDVSDLAGWQDWVARIRPELIVHLAGQAIVPRAFKQPYLTYRSNALGTLAVLEAARPGSAPVGATTESDGATEVSVAASACSPPKSKLDASPPPPLRSMSPVTLAPATSITATTEASTA